MSTKRLMMIAIAVSITFVQEQMLNMIPNFSFTIVLIIVFSSVFTLRESLIFIFAYTFLDNLYWGTLDFFTFTPLILAWSLIPISYHTILKGTTNEYKLAFFGLGFGFIFGWIHFPFIYLKLGLAGLIPYIMSDILFEVILAATGGLTTLWLFQPLRKALLSVIESTEKITVLTKAEQK